MRKLTYILVLFVLALLSNFSAKASHLGGGFFQWTCLGGNQYSVTLTLYRDCSPSSASAPSSATFSLTNTCNLPNPSASATGVLAGTLTPALYCPGYLSQCNGGSLTSYQIWTYTATITLPPCSLWLLSYSISARNGSIVNGGANQTFYIHAGINTAAGCDTSPTITQPPVSLCVGQQLGYNLGAIDADGDSMTYALVPALTAANSPINYNSPYSGTYPGPNTLFNPTTGQLSFVPSVAGPWVFAFQVNSYNSAGVLTGYVVMDFQFVAVVCTNKAPTAASAGIINYTGGGNQTGPNSIAICRGDTFSLSYVFADSLSPTVPNGPSPGLSSQTITVLTNAGLVMPGAVLTQTGTNPTTATISWVAPNTASGNWTFTLQAKDSNCPTPGVYTTSINLQILYNTIAIGDTILCLGQTAELHAINGSNFNWTAIYGTPVSVGSNFSCNLCADPLATPTVTTLYQVTSNLTGGCINYDSVLVQVVPDFNLAALPDTAICDQNASFPLIAQTSPPAAYTYSWATGFGLTSPTSQTPNITPPSTHDYLVSVTSPQGCVKVDTASIVKTPPFPGVFMTTDQDTICGGDSTQITAVLVNMANGVIPACGFASTNCSSSQTSIVGSNDTTNSTTTFPSPYANNFRSVKQQYLYKASELIAAGVPPGKINALSFFVNSKNGVTPTFNFYNVKIGCTSLTELTSFVNTGLVQVYGPATHLIVNGVNNHNFGVGVGNFYYNWDGVSNIIVEVCYSNLTAAPTYNAICQTSVTSYTSSVYYAANNLATCPYTGAPTGTSNLRPVIQFSYCTTPNPAAYNFTWTPSLYLSDSTVYNPKSAPDSSITYTVVVADTFLACSTSAMVSLNVSRVIAPNDTIICAADSIDLHAIAIGSCPPGSGTPTYTWTGPGIITNANTQTARVAPVSNSTYVVTYNNGCGCSTTDSVTVFIDSIYITPPTSVLPTCGFNNGSITVNTTGGVGYMTYSLDSGATYQPNATFSNLGVDYYWMNAQDSLGCKSDPVMTILNNLGAPTITAIQSTNLTCYSALDGQISIVAAGGTGTIQYSIDSGNVYQTNPTFTNLAAIQYNVVIQDALGCIALGLDTLFQNPQLAFVSANITPLLCYQTNTGQVSVATLGGAGNNTFSVDNQNNFVPSAVFTGLSGGNHTIYAKDGNGCITDTVVNIPQPAPIAFNFYVTNDSCFQSCKGSVVLNSIQGGTPTYTYTWSNGVSNTNYINNLCAGNYSITATDANGCTKDSTVTISQPALLKVDSISVTDVSCFGFSDGKLQAHVTGGTLPYYYSRNGTSFQSSNTFSNLPVGTYTITVKDLNNCTASLTATITQPTQLLLSKSNDTTICIGSCIDVSGIASGGVAPYNYIWTNVPNATTAGVQNVCPTATSTTYRVKVEDSKGCFSAQRNIIVSLYPGLNVEVSNDTSICPGQIANLSAIAGGGIGSGYTYHWTPAVNINNDSIPNPQVRPFSTQQYVVEIADACTTPHIFDTITVFVNEVPVVDFSTTDPTGCEPWTVQFTNNSTLSYNCTWDIGPRTVANECGSFTYEYAQAGTYDVTLTVTSAQGCTSTLTKDSLIVIYPRPRARFSATPNPATVIQPRVEFTDESSKNTNSWLWDFGGLGSSEIQNPSFEFPGEDTATYAVTLRISTAYGCMDEITDYIIIEPEYHFYVPNAFTPNGDKRNDIFKPEGVGVSKVEYRLQIFDRWGNMIFETTDPNEGWNGSVMNVGELLPIGTYVWKIKTRDLTSNAEEHEYTGYISIVN